jgi:hypothetical protein
MKLTLILVCVVAMSLLVGAISAQDANTKHFAKDGLSFDYSNGWTVIDDSSSDAQQLTLTRSDSEALIKFFVHRGKVNTPEKATQAKTKIVDPYIAYTTKQFVDMGVKPEQATATTQIGGAEAEGVRITAVLDREPGEAGIYWTTLGDRLVVLTLFGPDKAIKKVMPTWDVVRNSLKIQPPPPKGAASPTPTPKGK